MRKTIIITLCLILTLHLVCACEIADSFSSTDPQSTSAYAIETTGSPESDEVDLPCYHYTGEHEYWYDSLATAKRALTDSASSEHQELMTDRSCFSQDCMELIHYFTNDQGKFYVPEFYDPDEKLHPGPVVFFSEEAYGMPWVSFKYYDKENHITRIELLYLDVLDKEISSAPSASEALRRLSPKAVNIGNDNYTLIVVTEEEISLADKTVSALRYEYGTTEDIMIILLYDNIYIVMWGHWSILTDEFFRSFSLK